MTFYIVFLKLMTLAGGYAELRISLFALYAHRGETCTELASTALPPTCAKPPPTIRYFYFFFFSLRRSRKIPLLFLIAAKRQLLNVKYGF